MDSSNSKSVNGAGAFDFLLVDRFLKDIVGVQALSMALETGLVDLLIREGSAPADALAARLGADGKGTALLLELLAANGVVERSGGEVRLSAAFIRILPFRDLLELKIEIANLAARDILDLFGELIRRPRAFARQSEFFALFAGGGSGEEAREAARRWMRITTILTRYEAQACLQGFDFGRSEYVLDVGGNSGELALAICRAHPQIHATVLDLPLVCEIGREHVRSELEAARISFVGGNALTDALPGGFDTVCFKSMLHDWPDPEAKRLLAGAAVALKPGGRLLIFERLPVEVGAAALPYALIPFLLFYSGYRAPGFYAEELRCLGFGKIRVTRVELDMPFILVTGTRA